MKALLEWLRKPRDARYYQIASLSCLLVYGLTFLRFDVSVSRVALILGVAFGAQAGCSALARIKFDPRSALISGLSLCLLMRTSHEILAAVAAVIAVGSKFVFRYRDKHIFNPTNLAIAALLLAAGDSVWVSPGQWGSGAFFGFLTACAGAMVVTGARRADITLAFLFFHAALIFARALRLGDPLAIPFHQLENGALIIFAFFMISDPRTTPDSRLGRIIFAALVAYGGYYITFKLFRYNGLLYSLALVSMLTPLIDKLLPGGRFHWAPKANAPTPPMPISA